MRLRHIKGAEEYVEGSSSVIKEPEKQKGKWKNVFSQDLPIHIEIGMGKGQFIENMALINKDVNFVGIERYDTVLFKAIRKKEKMELEYERLDNLKFISTDARFLADIFEEGEVERIYLNFSDPWPKDRHSNRRLTSPTFLGIYRKILVPGGYVIFKTDNEGLFDYSVTAAQNEGWITEDITRDLHRDEERARGNVMTEYEEKFSKKGNPIYRMIIRPGDVNI